MHGSVLSEDFRAAQEMFTVRIPSKKNNVLPSPFDGFLRPRHDGEGGIGCTIFPCTKLPVRTIVRIASMLEKTSSEAGGELSRPVADGAEDDVAMGTVRGKPTANPASSAQCKALNDGALEKEMEPIFNEFDSLFKALANK